MSDEEGRNGDEEGRRVCDEEGCRNNGLEPEVGGGPQVIEYPVGGRRVGIDGQVHDGAVHDASSANRALEIRRAMVDTDARDACGAQRVAAKRMRREAVSMLNRDAPIDIALHCDRAFNSGDLMRDTGKALFNHLYDPATSDKFLVNRHHNGTTGDHRNRK